MAEEDGCPAEVQAKLERRILVLTPEGDTLQVYEGEPGVRLKRMTPFDGKLLVGTESERGCSIFALQGV